MAARKNMNLFVPKEGQVAEENEGENVIEDENIQNTEPEFRNTQFDINPSQKQIQQLVFDLSTERKGQKPLDFNFLQDQNEDNLNINMIDFRGDDADLNHKFMTEQSIQSFQRTILERLSTQEQSFVKWQKESLKSQGIKFSADFRDLYDSLAIGSDCVQINQISNNYTTQKIRFDLLSEKNWKKPDLKQDVNSDGLSIVDKIVKFQCKLNQRALSTIISAQFRLRGNSQFNILLRTTNLENEESSLLRFVKEGYGYDMRLYILLGRYDTTQMEYLFIKKCEVPLTKISEDHGISDYIDINCRAVDLGNDQLNLRAYINGNIQDAFKIKYKSSLIPIFDNFSIFMIGTGEDLAISRAFIEQVDRQAYMQKKDKNCTNSARCYCNLLQASFSG
ncbi:hypothetical protein ABPG74_006350 [Tetrahymena malaccensis]